MNTSDVKEVKAQNRRVRREHERHLNRVRVVWSTPEGRQYMWGQLAGLFKTPMTGNSWTFFNCGEHNAALRLFNDVMEACPENFFLAQEESKKYQKRELGDEPASSTPPEKEDDNG